MGTPFFSIIIPTRDRSRLILDTVISAVDQKFHSFEVILSDNSSDDRTRDRLRASGRVGDITYIKPPREAAMPDHWEFATSQARGDYVLVLTDRSVLRQGALAAIYRAISEHGTEAVPVCSWRWSLFDDELGVELSRADGAEAPLGRMLASAEVAAEFVGPRKDYPYALPRALNSCYSATIATKIRARHGRLFFPTSPDFTSAFLMLAHAGSLLYIDAPLFISRGLTSSTGGTAYRTSESGYLETLGLKDWYRYVPIKAVLVENFLYEDFLAMRDMAGGGLVVEFDWVEYFARCYREILGKKGQNILTRRQTAVLQREWERALTGMGRDTQARVRLELRSMRGLRMRTTMRELLSEVGLLSAMRYLRKKLGRTPNTLPTTALKAAGHELPGNAGLERTA